ncbi:hypothetical protein ACIP2X_21625 [Streptomyces sp. NPDC089424]|uniref:hypothetical protein n=1 Tax=Streptomyces sp. NPDC089424 TaxID=3365917 RepID=UPI003826CD1D
MAGQRQVATAGAALPGRTRWGVFAAIAGVPVLLTGLLAVALVVAFLFTGDEDTGSRTPGTASCARALGFGGAALPPGAGTASCAVTHGITTAYAADFPMPRADLRGRPARTYPDAPAPRTDCADADADLCLDLGRSPAGLPDGVAAHGVRVAVHPEGAGSVRVYFSAFTVSRGP